MGQLSELLDLVNEAIIDAASGWWTLIGLFVFSVIDGFFPIVPSDSLVIALGTVNAEPGVPHWAFVIPAAAAGALLGDFIAYKLGAAIGAERFRWMRRPTMQRALAWARYGLDRRGVFIIFVGRFLPGARVAINFAAGATGFSLRRFLVIDAVASVVWAGWYVSLGMLGTAVFDNVLISLPVAIIVAVAVGWVFDKVFRIFTDWLDRRGYHLDPEGYQDTGVTGMEPAAVQRREDRMAQSDVDPDTNPDSEPGKER